MTDTERLLIISKLKLSTSNSESIKTKDVPKEYWEDERFVDLACLFRARELENASETLRNRPVLPRFGGDIKYASDAARNDKKQAMYAIRYRDSWSSGSQYEPLSDTLKQDEDIVLRALPRTLPAVLTENPEFMKKYFRRIGDNLQYHLLYKDNEEVVKYALIHGLNSFRYLSDRVAAMDWAITLGNVQIWKPKLSEIREVYKTNNEISHPLYAREYIGSYPDNWDYLAESIQTDTMLCFAFVEDGEYQFRNTRYQSIWDKIGWTNGEKPPTWQFWKTIPAEKFADPMVALIATWKSSANASKIPQSLLEDREFLHCLLWKKKSLSHAKEFSLPTKVQKDLALAEMCLIRQGPNSLQWFSEEIRSNRTLLLNAGVQNDGVLPFVSKTLLQDRDFVQEMLGCQPKDLPFVLSLYPDDKELILHAFNWCDSHIGPSIKGVSDRLRDDKELIMIAVRSHAENILHASKRLQADSDVIFLAVNKDGHILSKLNSELCIHDRLDIMMLAVSSNGYAFQHASDRLRNHADLAAMAISRRYSATEYLGEKLKQDIPFLKRIQKIDIDSLSYLPQEIRELLTGVSLETIVHRERRLFIHVAPRSRVWNKVRDAKSISLVRGNTTLLTIQNLAIEEYEDHGPVGSYLMRSAWSDIIVCGDFVFLYSKRGLDGLRSREGDHYGIKDETWDTEDRKDELYIIEIPQAGVVVDVQRIYALNKEKNEWERWSITDPHITQIGKNNELVVPQGLRTNAYEYYNNLIEMSVEPNAKLFKRHGTLIEDVYTLNAPQSFSSCGGAARICIDGVYRWLLPTQDGFYRWSEIKAQIDQNSDRDDWHHLRDHCLSDASEMEKKLVQEHFQSSKDIELQQEIKDFFDLQ